MSAGGISSTVSGFLGGKLNHELENSTAHIVHNAQWLGIALLAVNLSLIPIDAYIGANLFSDNLYLRLFVCLVSIPLIFREDLTTKFGPAFKPVPLVAVHFLLPLTYGLLLSLNAASTPSSDQSMSLWWVLQYLIFLLFYTQVANSYLLTLVIWPVTFFIAYYSSYLLPDPNLLELNRVMGTQLALAYGTAVVLGGVTNRNTSLVQTATLSTARAFGRNVGREMRGPLLGISSLIDSISVVLPTLVSEYSTISGISDKDRIPRRQTELLIASSKDISDEAKYAATVIDMLIANTSSRPSVGYPTEVFHASHLVGESIRRYPFVSESQKVLVSVTLVDDFSIAAPKNLLIHVIFNLIKNALYYVQQQNSGDISILIGVDVPGMTKDECAISVKDTGPGISKTDLPRIFDRFYSTTDPAQGSGIGLHFCKTVLKSIGGNVTVDSIEGEYSTFTLVLPRAQKPEVEFITDNSVTGNE